MRRSPPPRTDHRPSPSRSSSASAVYQCRDARRQLRPGPVPVGGPVDHHAGTAPRYEPVVACGKVDTSVRGRLEAHLQTALERDPTASCRPVARPRWPRPGRWGSSQRRASRSGGTLVVRRPRPGLGGDDDVASRRPSRPGRRRRARSSAASWSVTSSIQLRPPMLVAASRPAGVDQQGSAGRVHRLDPGQYRAVVARPGEADLTPAAS